MFRNFKSVEKAAYGRGSFDKLGDILSSQREDGAKYILFLVDEYFADKEDEQMTVYLADAYTCHVITPNRLHFKALLHKTN